MRFNETVEIIAVLLTMSKNFHVDMQSDIREPIWIKLGVLNDTIEFYILILVWVTLTLI